MCLVSRFLEAHGLPTLCLGSALDILSAGQPPRAVFLDYPLGHSAGKPFDREDQYAIVRAAVLGFDSLTQPGAIARLPNRWAETEDWKPKAAAPQGADMRQPRDESPRFQLPEDREAARRSGALPGAGA